MGVWGSALFQTPPPGGAHIHLHMSDGKLNNVSRMNQMSSQFTYDGFIKQELMGNLVQQQSQPHLFEDDLFGVPGRVF